MRDHPPFHSAHDEDALFAFTDRLADGDPDPASELEATARHVVHALRTTPIPVPPLPTRRKHALWEDIMHATNSLPVPAAMPDQSPGIRRPRTFSPSLALPVGQGRHPGSWRSTVSGFATLAVVLAMLIAGFWQAGGIGDRLSRGPGDEPIEFAAVASPNSAQDEGPDITASPAARGVCPDTEKSESDAAGFVDGAGLRELLDLCVSEFTWPDDLQPSVDNIMSRFQGDNWRTTLGAARSILLGFNTCAWSHVWIEAMNMGDGAVAAESKEVLLEILPAFAEQQPQAGYDLMLDAVVMDDVTGLSTFTMHCYPMSWAQQPVEAPAGTGTSDVLPATPTAQSECDLTHDMPVIPDGDLVEESMTYLKLADGMLSLVCDGSRTDLVTQVQNVMPLDYPGIVSVSFEPVELGTRRQGLLNVATGDLHMYGSIPEGMGFTSTRPEGSPWFISPDADDPSRWIITDLRTFQSRDLAAYLPDSTATEPHSVITDYSPETGKLLIVQASGVEQGTDLTVHMALIESLDGEVTHLETMLDLDYVIRSVGLDSTGNSAYLYAWADPMSTDNPVEGALLTVFDLRTGSQVLQEDAVELTNTGPRWAAGRNQLVYTAGNRVVSYDTSLGETTDLYTAPNGDTFQDIRYGPDDSRIVVEHFTPSTDEQGDADLVLVATVMIDVVTDNVSTIDGIIVAPNLSPWPNYQRFVATIPAYDAQPVTVTILDLETMQPVGDPITFPDGTDPTRLLGPDGAVSTADGTTMVIAFNPDNPHLITADEDGSDLAPLFAAGEQPRFSTSGLNLSQDGRLLSSVPDGSGTASATLVDLSGSKPATIEIDGNEQSGFISFVEGIDD